MKKLLSLVLTLSLLLCCANFVFASEEINVVINDKKITFTEPPVMENDRILVPIRAIAEAIQFDVGWDQNTQKVTLDNFNTTLTFYINQNTIKKDLKLASEEYNGKVTTITIDVPAKIIDSRTYIPLRAIAELFGATVDWDQTTSTANIIYDLLYGDPVEFKDEGMEYLTRLAITLGDIDTTNLDNLSRETRVGIGGNTLKTYEGPIHKGVLKNISTLGVNRGYTLTTTVHSIEDISMFPNLVNLYLVRHDVRDISPLTYKSNWNEIDISENLLFDFTPLQKIQVNHFIYVGYRDYFFSYLNKDFTPGSTLSNTEKEKYDLFVTNLNKIFGTMQNLINEKITSDMTRSEKVRVVYDWIRENIEYDYDRKFFEEIPTFFTNVDDDLYAGYSNKLECAVLYGYAVCEGYSIVFEIFCDMLDIPCIKIDGYTFNNEWEDHEWNVVKLEDGNLYHVDPTWHSTDNYLLVTDEQMPTDHKWDKDDMANSFNAKYKYFPYKHF